MSEYTEQVRRAAKTAQGKLFDALDRMEKELKETTELNVDLLIRNSGLREERDEALKANEDFVLAQAQKVGAIANLRYLVKSLYKYYPHTNQYKCSCDVCVSLKDMGFLNENP